MAGPKLSLTRRFHFIIKLLIFRDLKMKPKYGHIFHSTFIRRASTKNKGRISRFLPISVPLLPVLIALPVCDWIVYVY